MKSPTATSQAPWASRDLSRRTALRHAIGLALSSLLPAACSKARRGDVSRDAASLEAGKRVRAPRAPSVLLDALEQIEITAGGRLGVCVLDTATGAALGHRLGERFAMCSTFKVLLAGAILREAESGRVRLDTRIEYTKADMLSYAPVTSVNLERGWMTVSELAEAAQKVSDNVAANLLLKHLGGPSRFTAILRATGDEVSRLDRYEPGLNLVPVGEVRDTTTPVAMANSLHRFLVGDALTQKSRELLIEWMESTTTGDKRIRAGLPSGWRAGDKTGTAVAPGMANKYNDVAIIMPPGQTPHIVAAYYEAPGAFEAVREKDEAVLAEVGRRAAAHIAG